MTTVGLDMLAQLVPELASAIPAVIAAARRDPEVQRLLTVRHSEHERWRRIAAAARQWDRGVRTGRPSLERRGLLQLAELLPDDIEGRLRRLGRALSVDVDDAPQS